MRKFWQYVRVKTGSSSGIGDLKLVDGAVTKIINTDFEKSELFSDYFEKIFTVDPDGDFSKLPEILPVDVTIVNSFSVSDVAKVLSKIKVNKSPGPDLLHPRIFYELRNFLAFPLACLFSRSLLLGEIPDEWKTSHVTVLYKKGKKDCIENYRPISLTCICCKLMETLVRDIVLNHFVSNNLFSDKQYGFIKGRSTVLQLLKLTDEWTSSLDDNAQIDVIYTDFEKAFDKVSHRRLLSKLSSYGLNANIIDWIRSFLSFRYQRVKVNGVLSNYKQVLSVIPQGSVLSPLLFVIYINDLPTVCNFNDLYMFADDAKMYKSIKDNSDYITLKRICQDLFDWSEQWLMKLNVSKCKVLSLCRNSGRITQNDYGFDIPGQGYVSIEYETTLKDLGVIVDSDLSFDEHVHDKISVANRMLGIIRRNFADLDKFSLVLLYKSLVRSHLEYAGPVWNPHRKGLIKDIESIQKRATKLIRVCKNMSYKERLMFLCLPTLRYRRFRGDMLEVFKILNNFYDSNTVPILSLHHDVRTRGNALKLKISRCNYDVRKFSFCNRVVKVWNSLPDIVVLSCSINNFKHNLDKHFSKESYFYDYEWDPYGLS